MTLLEVKIICPECNSIQDAIIQDHWPWPVMLHTCNNCEYIIMESEWNKLETKK